jgi:hypothetical protein
VMGVDGWKSISFYLSSNDSHLEHKTKYEFIFSPCPYFYL